MTDALWALWNDPRWAVIGNWELVAFTLSYLACFVLFVVLRPDDRYEWVTTAKIGGVAAVGVNGVLVVFFAIGTAQPLRVLVFGVATVFCWWFTILSYRVWLERRRDREET